MKENKTIFSMKLKEFVMLISSCVIGIMGGVWFYPFAFSGHPEMKICLDIHDFLWGWVGTIIFILALSYWMWYVVIDWLWFMNR